MIHFVIKLLLALTSVVAFARAAEDRPVIFGRSDAEGKGVVLLDAFTFDRVIDHLKGVRIMVGFFDKKDSRRRADPKEQFSSESRNRENYLGFALHAIKDLEADARDLIFAQVIVNGKCFSLNISITFVSLPSSIFRRRKFWTCEALRNNLVPGIRAPARRRLFCTDGSKRRGHANDRFCYISQQAW
jgi:hypothetical protein